MGNYYAWDIKATDYPHEGPLQAKIKFIAGYGLLAASVHNTQPWRFRLGQNSLELLIDNEALGEGDPTKRETWISLGACAQNIILAAESFGLSTPSCTVGPLGIMITFKDRKLVKNIDAELLRAISLRHTNRGKFNSKVISSKDLEAIRMTWKSENIEVVVSTDKVLKDRVADLTGASIKMALSMPKFRKELSSLMRVNWTTKPTGMPGFVLGKGNIASLFGPMIFRYFNLGSAESERDTGLIKSASAIVLILSSGEGNKFWFEAGRAYEQIGIVSTKLGLSNGTFAAAVEAPDVHKEIESELKTNRRLQAVMRLGYSNAPIRHSPRKCLEEVLIT